MNFKQSQNFRIICGDVCFYTTKKQIASFSGVGDFSKFNAAVQKALLCLELEAPHIGISGTWEGLQIQINTVAGVRP